ncbi:hypothetical protein AX768_07015 [Burkholderia sp. PAMC 28687]|uniref:hypothetical protein n=1 Tax=Burkholderia sp. PAMC 28687 TaxID=1795874 RepID=UPI000780E3B6|nr:hypothetical protein [Burkholderia sp. PAMC 28687]AMM13888.1 hypothetical protein AX768_07015 [Burkholderia sp. PAMC 28687]
MKKSKSLKLMSELAVARFAARRANLALQYAELKLDRCLFESDMVGSAEDEVELAAIRGRTAALEAEANALDADEAFHVRFGGSGKKARARRVAWLKEGSAQAHSLVYGQ